MKSAALSADQLAYAAARAVHDLAFEVYMANDDEEATDEVRALYAAWMAAKADLRAAERVMVDSQIAKLKGLPVAKGRGADLDFVATNATGEHWARIVDLCFRAA